MQCQEKWRMANGTINLPDKGCNMVAHFHSKMGSHVTSYGGALSAVRAQCARRAGAVQLFGRLAVLETHTLRY